MDEAKEIQVAELKDVVARTGFNQQLIIKDYYATLLLYLLRDVEGIHFKGGTALQKIFLDYTRLSEDLDFTVTSGIPAVREKIKKIVKECEQFTGLTKDKDVEGFLRLLAHFRDSSNQEGEVIIDLNSRTKLLLRPQRQEVPHFYHDHIPKFTVSTLALKELVAEKVAAAIGRNQPRDHFDIYQVIRHKLPIDMKLVRRKCEASGHEFSVIRMFNRAKKLKNRWDEDLLPLVRKEVHFETVMKTLAKQFRLADEKERLKRKRPRGPR